MEEQPFVEEQYVDPDTTLDIFNKWWWKCQKLTLDVPNIRYQSIILEDYEVVVEYQPDDGNARIFHKFPLENNWYFKGRCQMCTGSLGACMLEQVPELKEAIDSVLNLYCKDAAFNTEVENLVKFIHPSINEVKYIMAKRALAYELHGGKAGLLVHSCMLQKLEEQYNPREQIKAWNGNIKE